MTLILNWVLGKLVKPNDPQRSGRELYVAVRGFGGESIRLFWLPLKNQTGSSRGRILKDITDKYPGCKIRLAQDEDPLLWISLKLREFFGHEWRKND